MNPNQPPVVFDSARGRAHRRRVERLLLLLATIPVPMFFLVALIADGPNFSSDTSRFLPPNSASVLLFPMLVSFAFLVDYLWRRRCLSAEAPSADSLIASVAVVLFFVWSLVGQSHKNALLQRTIEAQLQPWAESVLSRPRAEVLREGSNRIRFDEIPRFIANHYSAEVTVQKAGEGPVEANESKVVVVYRSRLRAGYIAGRRTLKVREGTPDVHKVKDGLYRFQDED